MSKSNHSTNDFQYKPQRWTGFLTGVKEESLTFRKVMSEITKNKDQSNAEFAKFAKESFFSIHRGTSLNDSQYRKASKLASASRLSQTRPKTAKNPIRRRNSNVLSVQERQESPFEFDIRISNHDRWPKRASSARRILAPVKLQDYPDLERPKDIVCVLGAPIDPLVPL